MNTKNAVVLILVLLVVGVAYFVFSTQRTTTMDNSPIALVGWVYSSTSPQGIQFLYPQTLPTTYISTTAGWPPEVTFTSGDLSCVEKDKRMVGDITYCVVEGAEGAAGSTYKTYEYTTVKGNLLAHVKFTLQFPQCVNYDEPNQSVCKNEQMSFDINGLVDRIVSSIRMR